MPVMRSRLDGAGIRLLEGDRHRQLLFVFLHRDGSVNRMGDGTLRAYGDFRIGRVTEPLFDQFMEDLSEGLLDYAGRYDLPDRRGLDCNLEVKLFSGGALGANLEFHFGSESLGPPAEIRALVTRALELTEAWWRLPFQSDAPRPPPDPDLWPLVLGHTGWGH